MTPLLLGTRRSALARTQSQQVADALRAATGCAVELVEVTTEGDRSALPLAEIGGTGVFVTALREALLAHLVHLAVHSLKDLPTSAASGISLAAVPEREDPRDVFVGRDGLTLAELPPGARVGTGSPRRAAQLRALGLGLDVVPIRGNVDTRLRLVRERSLDAVVLARAGLARLGRLDEITEVLDPMQMLPAPGQGALAVECLTGAPLPDVVPQPRGPVPPSRTLDELLSVLDSAHTRAAVTAERTLLAVLEAGCTAPVGALAEVGEGDSGPELYLRAVVASPDGSTSVRLSATGPLDEPEVLGRRLAGNLLAEGVADLMGERVE